MKNPRSGRTTFFVDESGDPVFYDRKGNLIVGCEGCSPVLMIGFIETQSPRELRREILDLQKEIVQDPYFQGVPSLSKTAVAFHAKDDLPEIRHLFFKLLATLDFRAQIVVARKIERVFRNNFGARETAFYDHLVSQLFENVLHRYEENVITSRSVGQRRGSCLWPEPSGGESNGSRRSGIIL